MKLFSTLNTPDFKAINILPIGDPDEIYGSLHLIVLTMTSDDVPGFGFMFAVGRPWFHVVISIWKKTFWFQLGELA